MTLSWYTKAEDVFPEKDLSGTVAVVTGANSGIGLEASRVLLSQGAHVVFGCRDVDKAKAALASLNNPDLAEIIPLDLASLASVTEFARCFSSKYQKLDILINNAGVMATPYLLTQDGFEIQFAVNYLAHFHLTNLLMPKLELSPSGRIVNVSSMGHRINMFDLEDLQASRLAGSRSYRWYYKWVQYGNSKLAQVLFTIELNRRLRERQSTVSVYSIHPGCILTNLFQYVTVIYWICFIFTFLCKTVEQGAATTIFCAIHPGVKDFSGGYFKDCRPTKPILPLGHAAKAQKLWEISEGLVETALSRSGTK